MSRYLHFMTIQYHSKPTNNNIELLPVAIFICYMRVYMFQLKGTTWVVEIIKPMVKLALGIKCTWRLVWTRLMSAAAVVAVCTWRCCCPWGTAEGGCSGRMGPWAEGPAGRGRGWVRWGPHSWAGGCPSWASLWKHKQPVSVCLCFIMGCDEAEGEGSLEECSLPVGMLV